jgi:4-amino-4-deoxy-L-arabinose transferase-like glycosyltransferase
VPSAGRRRLPGITSGGATTSPGGGTSPRGTPPGGTNPGGPSAPGGALGTGWTKLLGSTYGPEIGWLYPLAVLALLFGLVWTRRAQRTNQVRAGFVMWGIWLMTFGLIFSKMSTIPHTAYVSSLAPPLAALSAAGIVMFWQAYRARGWRGWALPVVVGAELRPPPEGWFAVL